MAAAALDNANPTILNASQLPSRQKRSSARRKGPESKYSDIVFSKPSFLQYDSSFSASSSSDEDSWSEERSDEDDLDGYPEDDFAAAAIDEQEIYDLTSTISDPEHPVSLGQLSVINLSDIHISPPPSQGVPGIDTIVNVTIEITPTITHCSLATVIGLGVRVRLDQVLPPNYRIHVKCKKDSHTQDDQVNKQLADKERVAAALENDTLKGVLDKMLETCA